MVIALKSYTAGICQSPADLLGIILYNGPFNPVLSEDASKPPHENFNVTIPDSIEKGLAQLGVVHFSLIGVS